jgi:predicted RNA-binding Zn ribbon-like protein
MQCDSTASEEAGGLRSLPDDLCLSFANTLSWRGSVPPTEELLAPSDLLRWCAASAGLDAGRLREMEARWAADPAAGTAALSGAIALREALYRMFSATAGGAGPEDADIALLNGALTGRTRLLRASDGLAWALPEQTDPSTLLAPVLWSAGDLLTGRRLAFVRCCANPRCQWLFLDDSKGGTRRWCSMASCGNRAKAQRHYARRRATRAA